MAIKISVEHGRTKRQIDGPFNLFIDADTAALITEHLNNEFRGQRGKSPRWIRISEVQPFIMNTPPIPWDVAGPDEEAVDDRA